MPKTRALSVVAFCLIGSVFCCCDHDPTELTVGDDWLEIKSLDGDEPYEYYAETTPGDLLSVEIIETRSSGDSDSGSADMKVYQTSDKDEEFRNHLFLRSREGSTVIRAENDKIYVNVYNRLSYSGGFKIRVVNLSPEQLTTDGTEQEHSVEDEEEDWFVMSNEIGTEYTASCAGVNTTELGAAGVSLFAIGTDLSEEPYTVNPGVGSLTFVPTEETTYIKVFGVVASPYVINARPAAED